MNLNKRFVVDNQDQIEKESSPVWNSTLAWPYEWRVRYSLIDFLLAKTKSLKAAVSGSENGLFPA